MVEKLKKRLEDLKNEYNTGQNRLRELESQQASVRETMLRINGAIIVLEEILKDEYGGGQKEENIHAVS